jgi:hypothetical protein
LNRIERAHFRASFAPFGVKDAMRRTRRRFVAACGKIGSSFKALNGRAVMPGVGFWDIPHGQTGAAPNYIELHPLLRFRMTRGLC